MSKGLTEVTVDRNCLEVTMDTSLPPSIRIPNLIFLSGLLGESSCLGNLRVCGWDPRSGKYKWSSRIEDCSGLIYNTAFLSVLNSGNALQNYSRIF